jgi:hypothetical protein
MALERREMQAQLSKELARLHRAVSRRLDDRTASAPVTIKQNQHSPDQSLTKFKTGRRPPPSSEIRHSAMKRIVNFVRLTFRRFRKDHIT